MLVFTMKITPYIGIILCDVKVWDKCVGFLDYNNNEIFVGRMHDYDRRALREV